MIISACGYIYVAFHIVSAKIFRHGVAACDRDYLLIIQLFRIRKVITSEGPVGSGSCEEGLSRSQLLNINGCYQSDLELVTFSCDYF